ncbi:tRNA-specific adenosine deaminase subunit tad3 [Coemansia sp. RSA 2706]|nr:tRNA-specific adenosine deaminase subunit tad3 [Coemansia sp. RSA 2706]
MVHRIECGNYSIERIPYEEETQKLDTEDVYIAQIAPTQTARILQFIGKTLPKLDGIEHVKRVRRDESNTNTHTLLVILCQCRMLDRDQLDALIQGTEWADLEILAGAVPVTPPYTLDQFERWKKVWPVTYRPPLKLKRPEFSSKEAAYIELCLQKVEELKKQGTEDNGRAVAVIMGSAQTHKIVAKATDTAAKSGNPLDHAVMNCIALVADMELARLAASSLEDGLSGAVPTKRLHDTTDSDCDTAGYLCEGLDVFSSKEPCVMCTMALVHSRIGRLFFVDESRSGGVSYYNMHSHKALNHRFIAFKCKQ